MRAQPSIDRVVIALSAVGMLLIICALALFFFSLAVAVASTALAQQPFLHHHKGATAVIDEFYSFWLRPNNGNRRVSTCCSGLDCYVPELVDRAAGHWRFKHRESGRMVVVPDTVVEHMQPDPRESPDGRSHVCSSPYGHVYCFVVGSPT